MGFLFSLSSMSFLRSCRFCSLFVLAHDRCFLAAESEIISEKGVKFIQLDKPGPAPGTEANGGAEAGGNVRPTLSTHLVF